MNNSRKTTKTLSSTVTTTTDFDRRLSRVEGILGTCVSERALSDAVQKINEWIERHETRHTSDVNMVMSRYAKLVKDLEELRHQRTADECDGDSHQETETFINEVQVMLSGIEALKAWTGKARAMILYDSAVDPFTEDGLFEKVAHRPNVAVIAFTKDDDVFGAFHSIAVSKQDDNSLFDPNLFAFSFESHGRCETPQRFPVKERLRHRASLKYYHCHSRGWFLWVGVDKFGSFQIGNEESATWCFYPSLAFEGMERTTLTGSTWESQEKQNCHRCSRIIALQMV